MSASTDTVTAPTSRSATAALLCAMLFFVGLGVLWLLHPNVPAALIASLVVLPLAAVGLGVVARRHIRSGSASPFGAGRANAAVVIGSVSLALVAAVAFILPNLCRAREPAQRIKCASNLRQIGLAITQYAEASGGQFPPSLDVLTADLATEVFVCPSSSDDRATGPTTTEMQRSFREPGHVSYVYTAANLSTATATPAHVLAYEHLRNHKNQGINVLYGDGHVDFLDKAQAERLIAELNAGHNPPAAPKQK